MTLSQKTEIRLSQLVSPANALELLDHWRTIDSGETFTVTGDMTISGDATNSGTLEVTGTSEFGQVTLNGVASGSVTKLLLDASGNALLASCATANIPASTGYAKGCILIATDASDHSDLLFANIGDATTANFNLITVAADA